MGPESRPTKPADSAIIPKAGQAEREDRRQIEMLRVFRQAASNSLNRRRLRLVAQKYQRNSGFRRDLAKGRNPVRFAPVLDFQAAPGTSADYPISAFARGCVAEEPIAPRRSLPAVERSVGASSERGIPGSRRPAIGSSPAPGSLPLPPPTWRNAGPVPVGQCLRACPKRRQRIESRQPEDAWEAWTGKFRRRNCAERARSPEDLGRTCRFSSSSGAKGLRRNRTSRA